MERTLLARYEELYHDMATSKDVEKMKVFGNAEKWIFAQLLDRDPKLAEMWLEKLEGSHWCNYLSKGEAEDIVANLENQDGTKGGKWSYEQFEEAVASLNGKMECEPKYNRYALWTTANMLYSDHAESLSEFIEEKDYPKAFYMLSVETLKDIDHPRFVREYFGV